MFDNVVINFFVVLILLLVLSFALEFIWFKIFAGRNYQLWLFPGVIVHEFSHAVGCVLVGAKIEEISLFSQKGSYVKHRQPKIPFVGDVVISFAPIVGGIAFLWCSAGFLGIKLFSSFDNILDLVNDFWVFSIDNWREWTFWIFVYLLISVLISLAPSKQDFKNSAISLLVVLAFMFLLFKLGYFEIIENGVGYAIDVITMGLFFGLMALAISLPIYILKKVF
ncbi:MAG: hypothetical protein PHV25_01280 [Candidatus Pacebacteria bacterium]|nr:hypothetical protein [Candidatus Paceibacterota bacterium]